MEAMEQHGWRIDTESSLRGRLEREVTSFDIRIVIPTRFPFSPPRVFPPDEVEFSWHRERDGAMCLYPESGREHLPWLDVDDFLETIGRWLDATSAGWPADAPDMDLERYFTEADAGLLVTYDSAIDRLVGRHVRFTIDGPRVKLAGPGLKPRNARSRRHRLFGFVADVGEPLVPPRDWSGIREQLSPEVGQNLERDIEAGRVDLILLRYRRGTTVGGIALVPSSGASGIKLTAVPSAPSDDLTLRLRGGRDSDELGDNHVLVVGAGAIGSFVCDHLSRAGVGRITVRDGDVLRPGNVVRHLAPLTLAGYHKAIAVQQVLYARPFNRTVVDVDTRFLLEPGEVIDLIQSVDLVIDASADAAVSAMLAGAAHVLGRQILSASLQDEGRIVRVDVIPPVRGAGNPPIALPPPIGPEYFEAGCGDPVSMTPPHAAIEAAALTARLAVQLLTRSIGDPAGRTHQYG